jgi:hypothetical protein
LNKNELQSEENYNDIIYENIMIGECQLGSVASQIVSNDNLSEFSGSNNLNGADLQNIDIDDVEIINAASNFNANIQSENDLPNVNVGDDMINEVSIENNTHKNNEEQDFHLPKKISKRPPK